MVEEVQAKVKPIVKADVHAPIFCFPNLKTLAVKNVSNISRTISIDIKS
jgi:hypothetical protein